MSRKSEPPTPKRLRDARKKGQVSRSKEVSSTALLVALFSLFWLAGNYPIDRLKEAILLPTRYYTLPFEEALTPVFWGILKAVILLTFPALLLVIVVAMVVEFLQVGFIFAFETIKPDLKKINPVQGLKKIFSLKNLVELIKSILKISFLGIMIYWVIKDSIDPLLKIPYLGVNGIIPVLGEILKRFILYTAVVYIIIAIFDYFYQKYEYLKGLKMSREEVLREYKEMEGDPQIKGRRKQLHRELSLNSMIQSVKKASVVVTNPEHLAIALFYDREETKLPLILAKGKNLLAKRIVEIAREEGIPIMQNVPLAHSLFDNGEINQYIPSDLLEPVAEVLRWVQQLKSSQD